MLYKQMGMKIRMRRKQLGLTQEQLAEAVDISVAFCGMIERGKRIMSIATFYKMATKLDISADELLGIGKAAKKNASARELLMMAQTLSEALEDAPEESDTYDTY